MLQEPAFRDATQLATTWVDAHWDGPEARGTAVRAAALAAGLAALAEATTPAAGEPAPAVATGAERGRDGSSASWRAGARAAAVDRWPA
jgi:hypothetical protein